MTKSESRLLSSAVAGLLFGAPTTKLAPSPANDVDAAADRVERPAAKGARRITEESDQREEAR